MFPFSLRDTLARITVADNVATTCLDGLVWVSKPRPHVPGFTNPCHSVQFGPNGPSRIMSPLLCR
jgi:hypothetical protein